MVSRRLRAANMYLGWLCDLIGIGGGRSDRPSKQLAEVLHGIRFFWSIPNDDNREEDGKQLRYDFYQRRPDINLADLDNPCSVLEMMVALAIRIEYIVSTNTDGDQMPKYFWKMIENLNLDVYLNGDITEEDSEEIVDIINIFLERKYSYNGDGGLFPLKRPKSDQRRIEVWYQLMEFINENHGF